MIIFGWTVATIGVIGLCGSVILEIIKREPIYLLFSKISAGVLGLGGIILGIASLYRL